MSNNNREKIPREVKLKNEVDTEVVSIIRFIISYKESKKV